MTMGTMLSAALYRLQTGFFLWRAEHNTFAAEPALRSELFNAEQMESHAVELASRHRLRQRPGPDRLLARLDDNEEVLAECCKMFSAVTARSQAGRHVTPAGEWLLDNYWVVEEHIHAARRHLPKGYSKELPQLAEGPSAGLPRVYDIALENISHGDGKLDPALLARFVTAYQTVSPLTLGELWAIPIMLRLALIENLRRVTARVMAAWHDQKLAQKWADKLIETAERDRKSVLLAVAEMAASKPPMTGAFVAELARRLQGQNAALTLPLGWIEDLLAESGLSIDQLVQLDTQQQAADQVSIGNSMTSLRLLGAQDWRDFVEKVSVVEHILRRDPARVYPRTDFHTRDHYRHVVERLARKYALPEKDVAQAALSLAEGETGTPWKAQEREESRGRAEMPLNAHVGYYLIDAGLPQLKRLLAQGRYPLGEARAPKPGCRESWCRAFLGQDGLSLCGYLGLTLLFAVLLAWPFFLALRHMAWPVLALAAAAVPACLVASQIAVKLVNWLTTLCIAPRFLPRLDYRDGIPAGARTLVAVPCMIGTPEEVDELLGKLEVHYLGNRDPHVQFGLLTDFKDGPSETQAGDAALLERARAGIEALNRKYPSSETEAFFLCHRPRRWNETERRWIGYERKRGKLCEFNALLSGTAAERFALVVGDAVSPESLKRAPVRYVITLDADTMLPRDAARKLVGTMSHPLNRPVYDPERKRVVSGYAILQPRVGVTLPSANATEYARLFCSDAGIDPYTRNVSDVYQDLFRQGSYIGKGIYDVEAFELALRGRFPDNRVLSHDLIEGCYARSGLVSDVLLYEGFPACYSADVMRHYRWIRGDWQLLPWLRRRVRALSGKREPNPLTVLSRWKLLDNLRRSLVPLSLTIMLLLGWFCAARPIAWTLGLLALVFALPVLDALRGALCKPKDVAAKRHGLAVLRSFGQECLRMLLRLAWLPYEALYSTDAVLRTLWRLRVSKRHLLQWNPSGDVERTSPRDAAGLYRLMAVSPALGLAVAVLLPFAAPEALPAALPFALAWLLSPALAAYLCLPRARHAFAPSGEDLGLLHGLARKTWAFFDQYVGPEDNWLPPDNIRTHPRLIVAHRTSPTNIGLALLAHAAAYDLGYLSAGRLVERLENMFSTLAGLERHRGHFYNWYDTRTLLPLHPHYVSTVDSGNLAGHLLVLRQALLDLPDEPLFDPRRFEGLADAAAMLPEPPRAGREARQRLDRALAEARGASFASLHEAAEVAARIADAAEAARDACAPDPDGDEAFWFEALIAQCRDVAAGFEAFALPDGAPDDLLLPTLRRLAEADPDSLPEEMREKARSARERAAALTEACRSLAERAADMASMDFGFLYDAQRELLSIGYNVQEQRLDASYYDLLASEVRLTYFVAIAQGQLPQESWFALGRLLTANNGTPTLLSWSGSMFEYLMPMLVMPSCERTLLDEACRGAVARQIEYGRETGLPWGVSESAYNVQDRDLNYQYRAFGVPGLGLRRGLGEDAVIAPYATALALMVEPDAACRNLHVLASRGLGGRFGLYEALDCTPLRLPRGTDAAIIYSFMAHHQGMSLLSLLSVLREGPMQRRFLADPALQSTKLLLEERMPLTAPDYLHNGRYLTATATEGTVRAVENKLRVFTKTDVTPPAVQLLSNGRYHVMVSSAGGGYSRFRQLAVTRWHEDPTRDCWGQFCYLRDVATGDFWSAAHQPVRRAVDAYEAIFSEARAEFRVRCRGYDAHTEIVVSPEDDIELRRVHLTNHGRERRTLEVTSYGEVVLAAPGSDAQHPAFSKLFVQTEIVPQAQAILCTRRPRSAEESRLYLFHLLAAHGGDVESVSYETDRARFIGRGRTLADPAALDGDGGKGLLSGTAGTVLDPIVSIRCRVALNPGESAVLDLVTGVGETREACLALVDKYRDRHLADRVFDLAWTHSQVLLHHFNADLFEAHLFEQMASFILYANAALRANAAVLRANTRGQSGLWGQSISGDYPVVLLKIADSANIELVLQMVKAHAYWRRKGLMADLVIWNEDHAGYRQNLHDLIMSAVPAGHEGHLMDSPGGIFVRAAQRLSPEDRTLIESVARLIVSDAAGTLSEQVYRRRAGAWMPGLCPHMSPAPESARDVAQPEFPEERLLFANGAGGFTPDGTEYVITLRPGQNVPAPWCNVLANEGFGTIVSDGGGVYTWKENAQAFRLTPWLNDPVTDASGEALYLRDEATGQSWSPTPLPRRGKGSYRIRHGFGYSVYEHVEDGIRSRLTVFVAAEAPVKLSVLRVENLSGRPRTLTATGYAEWVLGERRPQTAMHVLTQSDPNTGTIFARNAYTTDFPGRVAFFDVDAHVRTISCDRTEFIGRNGDLSAPAALRRTCLSGRTGAGFDPCASIQTGFGLAEGESRELVFVLGAADGEEEAAALARRFADVREAWDELERVRAFWRDILGTVRVKTPDAACDVMLNGWLLYQVISSRFLARSGYYQSGGAFGFRDQLQDALAMLYADPQRVREHLLRCAAHQFPEGDVQHWWHPPLDRGVRTRCSDDYLWLPLAVERYVRITDDWGILDEPVTYIEMRRLNAEEEALYDQPARSQLEEPLYRHCVRAIEHGLRFGEHGLPLMGSGDWNDGMDRVGIGGKGESVWLGFFLYTVLTRFPHVARARGDEAFALRCESEAATLREQLDAHGWDGGWYRRAYFDDGSPLGSSSNEECRIDSISQSWSVLSGAAPDWRQRTALEALDAHLVRRDLGLVQLLTPPFDKTAHDPGYIKGYVPGVRENGGQYTHAAVWAAMAFAALGDKARAWELARMINPISHGDSRGETGIYKVEPYVVSADVYAVPPHEGRGGWSWYTGAAGWLYRLYLESLLGLRVHGDRLTLAPLLPADWGEVTLDYRHGSSLYHIHIQQSAGPDGPPFVMLDGRVQGGASVPLADDGAEHRVEMRLNAIPLS